MKKVILNADDFGLSHAVNESIITAYDQGILTSTTLLVCREASAEAVALARERPRLGVGLHLDLEGFFDFQAGGHFGLTIDDIDKDVYEYCTTQKADKLRSEICRQVELFLRFGLLPTHLDGHHHVHLFPRILLLVVEAMQHYGLKKIRFFRSFFADQLGAYEACRGVLDQATIEYPNCCLSLDEEILGRIWERINPGVTEIIIHTDLPGNDGEDWRIRQFLYLTGSAAARTLETGGFQPVTYSDW